MNHSYQDNIEELIVKTGMPKSYFYLFSNSPYAQTYNTYYQFCQENLSNTYSKFNIDPAKFYFVEDYSLNAGYGGFKGYRLIGVNKGTFHYLNNFFYSNQIAKENEELKSYYKLNASLDNPMGFIMFQSTLLFVFYHELTHLIQRLEDPEININEKMDGEVYSIESHIREMDADIYAAHQISKHCITYWGKQADSVQTEDNLNRIFAMSVSGIFIWFLSLYNNEPFYLKKSSHPHPIVRIIYIIHYMLHAIKSGYEGETDIERLVLNDVYAITEELAKNQEGMKNGLHEYATVLQEQKKDIENYIRELLKAGESMDVLARNRNMEI